MPDYLHHGAKGGPVQAMNDTEITSVVAWLASHRTGPETKIETKTESSPTAQPEQPAMMMMMRAQPTPAAGQQPSQTTQQEPR